MKGLISTYLPRCVAAVLTVLVTAVSVLLSSCERDPLYYLGRTPVNVVVNMDWRNLGVAPEGASIYFYPEGGGQTWSFTTNSVLSTMVQVPSGYYTVMVFNRTPDEYGTMHFRAMDSVSDACAVLDFRYSSWAGASDTVGHTVYEPETIVSGRTDHFYVHDIIESVRDTLSEWGYRIDTVDVTPQQFVMTGTVRVRVNGIHNAKSSRAYLTGMGGAVRLVPRTTCDSLCTHTPESWSLSRDAADYTKGYLVSEFRCFGLPDTYRQMKDKANNRFHIEVLLVDNKTVIKKDWEVGDLIIEYPQELRLTLDVSALDLPDVPPEGGTESGFDVTIDDWDDPDDVDIPL